MSQRAGMNVYNQMSYDLAKVKAELVQEMKSHDSEIYRIAMELDIPLNNANVEEIIKAIRKKQKYCIDCEKIVNVRCARCDQELK